MIRPRELFPDVIAFPTRTPTLPPATHTNCYALGQGETTLVHCALDVGGYMPDELEQIRADLNQVSPALGIDYLIT